MSCKKKSLYTTPEFLDFVQEIGTGMFQEYVRRHLGKTMKNHPDRCFNPRHGHPHHFCDRLVFGSHRARGDGDPLMASRLAAPLGLSNCWRFAVLLRSRHLYDEPWWLKPKKSSNCSNTTENWKNTELGHM